MVKIEFWMNRFISFLFVWIGFLLVGHYSFCQTVNLTIDYEVLNTVAGSSYESKLEIFADGKSVGMSEAKDQQIPNSVTVKIPMGRYELKAVLMANYQGKWQKRTIKNGYSNDFFWLKERNFKKDLTVKLYFDIASGVHENKMPQQKKNNKK